MPIYEAIYRSNDHEELITVNSIEQHEKFVDVKNHLYCTYQGCTARLSYVPKGKVRAHFKTWPKNNHIQDCTDYFERMVTANKQKSIATSTMALSDKHIKSVLDNLKRKRKEQESGTDKVKTNRKKKPRPKVNPDSFENTTLNIVPTTGPEADLTSGENNIKEPSVRNRSLINLSDDDLNWTRSVECYIQNVETDDNRAVLELRDGNYTFRVFFEEFFFDNAPINFRGYFEDLKYLVQRHKEYLFSGVGLIEKRNEQYCMLVNRGNDFRIDDQYIAIFLQNASA
ncbi:hypothetical protein I532_13349 [Brevibacillus borstelensis AK1]|uniref:Uncharacterized protein n=1 Tax=Brevibacillus borstelensis AK1 TaxID=1300222 RepID=M8EAZ5_9BACL|nr:hypothetical protein [Brevibacillus borstelensis]EMT52645.1 hypothetical protein I532_13349 [Brevibacillus borstelensis AK1]